MHSASSLIFLKFCDVVSDADSLNRNIFHWTTILKLYFISIKYATLQNASDKADNQSVQPVCVIKTDVMHIIGTARSISHSKACYFKRYLYFTSSNYVCINLVTLVGVTCPALHTYIHTCIYTYIGTYIHTYMHIYIHTHTYIYTYIHTYVHTYIYTYVHRYVHTYIHTYIHIYV